LLDQVIPTFFNLIEEFPLGLDIFQMHRKEFRIVLLFIARIGKMYRFMNKVIFGILILLLASASLAEMELDTDLMQTIEDVNKRMSSNIALKDIEAAKSDSKELTELFDKVESFFLKKGNAENAVELAKKSKGLTIEIVKAIESKNFTLASDSATALSRTCKTCHTFYKSE
jgi:hypothetical protein